jgi:tartrate dehydratase beta subunit/fumarate hydratase class I family protein
MQAVVVKRYKDEGEYQKDANKMIGKGYEIQSTVNEQPRTGCMRFVMLGGIGALVFKPKPVKVVTYRLAR